MLPADLSRGEGEFLSDLLDGAVLVQPPDDVEAHLPVVDGIGVFTSCPLDAAPLFDDRVELLAGHGARTCSRSWLACSLSWASRSSSVKRGCIGWPISLSRYGR